MSPIRSQPHRLSWPLTPTQVEGLDEMLQILFKRVNTLSTTPATSTAVTLTPSMLGSIVGSLGSGCSQDGEDGVDGPPGVQGPTGATGATGAAGSTGTQGTAGLGVPGIDGEDGIDGFPGPRGPTGTTGATGPQGPQGLGVPGLDGEGEENLWMPVVNSGVYEPVLGLPSVSGHVLSSTTAGVRSWTAAGSGAMTLIEEVEGTDTTAAATNVATIAISGLTVKDSLRVLITMSAVTQLTAAPILYNSTDSVRVSYLGSTANLSAGQYAKSDIIIGPDQSSSTKIISLGTSYQSSSDTFSTGMGVFGVITFTTDWTGSWTLALRTGAGGVTAGGTFRYRIAVYKIAGQ